MWFSKALQILFSVFILVLFSIAYASEVEIAKYFDHKTGCFILYDLTAGKMVEKYNSARCSKRVSTDSTFKIPLSVMAFDQGLISQETIFKWDGHEKGMQQWDHDQTPQTWLRYSVVWVSQAMTPKLGMPKIKKYLNDFDYGNQDFSGTPGKHDGLMQAWLSNSLRISADEQFVFLKKLVTYSLPVTKRSMAQTKHSMFLSRSENGWSLYGKTGSGHSPNQMTEGWFVGFTQKGRQQYIFVTNFTDNIHVIKPGAAGVISKSITMKILKNKNLI